MQVTNRATPSLRNLLHLTYMDTITDKYSWHPTIEKAWKIRKYLEEQGQAVEWYLYEPLRVMAYDE